MKRISRNLSLAALCAGLAFSSFLASCSTIKAPAPDYGATNSSIPRSERHGLGTSWGEDRESRVDYTSFERGSSLGTGKFYYNDRIGSRAMANRSGYIWKSGGGTYLAGSSVYAGLKSSSGTFLPSYSASGGKRFFVGESGDRYRIYIKNRRDHRIEVVVSVDGLDVLDGKRASTSKRGYIVRANDTLTIEGFRRSSSEVAAFRFGSVDDSYAEQKHGDSRNVGVIGIAVYAEKSRWSTSKTLRRSDTYRRTTAEPFENRRYATPPN